MAKKQAEGKRKALLLSDCHLGKCGQVLELDAAEVELLKAHGLADDNDAAIAAHE